METTSQQTAFFLKYSNQEKVQLSTILAGLQRHSPKVWRKILDPSQEVHLYFTGARNGIVEIPFIKLLLQQRGAKKGMDLIYQGVSAVMRREFQRRIVAAGLRGFIKEYQIIPFDDPLYLAPHVHFSLAPYTWHEITHWKDTPQEHNSLVKFQKTLMAEGVGLMMFRYHESDAAKLQGVALSSFVSGEEVVEELSKLKVRHQAYIVDVDLNVSSCFQQGRFHPNSEGEELLSFILRMSWKLLPDHVQHGIGEQLAIITAGHGKEKIILQDLYIWIFPGSPRGRRGNY